MASQLAADLARGGLLAGTKFYVDVKGAAGILHVSSSFLNKARTTGTGPPYVKFGAAVRYDVHALEIWADSRTRSSTSNSGEAALFVRHSEATNNGGRTFRARSASRSEQQLARYKT
jgi:hypothetical protein